MYGGNVHLESGCGNGKSVGYGSATIRCQGKDAKVFVYGGTLYMTAHDCPGAFHAGIQNTANTDECPIDVGNCYVWNMEEEYHTSAK